MHFGSTWSALQDYTRRTTAAIADQLRAIAPEKYSAWELLFAAAQAVLVFAVFTDGHSHPFLFDDNKSQWLPVTDYGLDQWFQGRSPNWNPYILNGVRVDDVGYYGLANPLMIAAFALSRCGISNTLSLYIWLTYIAGSLFAYALARNLGSNPIRSAVLVFLFQLAPGLWSSGYWYYTFNNLLAFPALFWGLHRFLAASARAKGVEAVRFGLLLGFAFALGNPQFAIYQWLIVGGTALCSQIYTGRLRRDYHYPLVTLTTALLVAAPVLWMYTTCGKFPLEGRGASAAFPLTPLAAAHSYVCNLRVCFGGFGGALNGNPGGLPALLLIPLTVVWFRNRGTTRVCLFSAVCFLVLVMIFASGYVVKNVPILNKFRVAYKWWLCVPPLLFYIGCLTAPLLRRQSRQWILGDGVALTAAVVAAVMSAVPAWPAGKYAAGCLTTAEHDFSGFRELAPRLDLRRFRLLPVFARPEIDDEDRHAFHACERHIERHLTANAAAELKVFSTTGYHLGLRREMVDATRTYTDNPMFYMGADANLVRLSYELTRAELAAGIAPPGEHRLVPHVPLPPEFIHLPDAEAAKFLENRKFDLIAPNGDALSREFVFSPDGRVQGRQHPNEKYWRLTGQRVLIVGWKEIDAVAWLNRLQSAGIKYLVLDTEHVDDVAERLRATTNAAIPFEVIRGRAFSVIELADGAGLVTDQQGRSLGFAEDGNGLSIAACEVTGPVVARFNYDRDFHAVGVSADGGRIPFQVSRTPEGFMQVDVAAGAWKQIELRVRDRRVAAATFFHFASLASFAGLCLIRRRSTVKDRVSGSAESFYAAALSGVGRLRTAPQPRA